MPGCFNCKRQFDILMSRPIPGQTMGVALCETCYEEVEREDKNKRRKGVSPNDR